MSDGQFLSRSHRVTAASVQRDLVEADNAGVIARPSTVHRYVGVDYNAGGVSLSVEPVQVWRAPARAYDPEQPEGLEWVGMSDGTVWAVETFWNYDLEGWPEQQRLVPTGKHWSVNSETETTGKHRNDT